MTRMRRINHTEKDLSKSLTSRIPKLLDELIELTKSIGVSARLSNTYPYRPSNSNGQLFEEMYSLLQQRIYRLVFDSKADLMGSENGCEEEVSREEFLDWVRQDPARAVDVYNHMVRYIREAPRLRKLVGTDGSEAKRLMMEYV